MITNALLLIIYYTLAIFLNLLPISRGLPPDMEAAFNTLITEAVKWNNLLPVYQLFLILGIVFSFETGILLFKTINWIINKIRGSGG